MEYIEKYKKWLMANGATHNTIVNYCSDIKRFLSEITIRELEHITEEELVDYIVEIQSEYASSSSNRHKNAINNFLNEFLNLNIRIPKTLKIIKRIPDFITVEYFKKRVIPQVLRMKNDLRNRTILYFMFDTGLRVGEVGFIKRKDFNFENNTVKILNNKSKMERIIPYTDTTRSLLNMYFSTHTEDRNAFNIERENLRKMFKVLKPYFPDIKFRPHLLRHSCAISSLRLGLDVSYVQALLGHKDIKTTMIYLTVTNEMLLEKYQEKINIHRWRKEGGK